MRDTASEVLRTRLLTLREAYATQLPSRVGRMEKLWGSVQEGRWDPDVVETLHRLAHSLTGSGPTLGQPAVGERARALEGLIRPLLDRVEPASSEQRRAITGALEELRDLADRAAASSPPEASAILQPPPAPGIDRPVVCLVGGDGALAGPLEQFGYRAVAVPDASRLPDAAAEQAFAAILLDASGPGAPEAAAWLAPLQERRIAQIPIVFLSPRDDLAGRLQAVHAGGDAYVTYPVDLGCLVDKLDELTGRSPREPYRILIVEDDPLLAAHNATVLEQAGMHATIVTDPFKILEPLADCRPDLILMDVYMPGCNGTDLAAVIRQHEDFVGIPIVFLSAEARLDRRLQAMLAGGDDFLVKPVRREHLVSSVAARISRARAMRSMMERDGLTRLLNHTHFMAELETELSRVQRRAGRLSYVMIDLDHFKQVNDTHGHRAGDRVLKSLARLLRQRFRLGDLVGRYGGEEFVLALADADLPQAIRAMEDLRAAFSLVAHSGRQGTFSVTISAGVADYPRFASAAELHEAADRALYEAKSQGRNRVVAAAPTGVAS